MRFEGVRPITGNGSATAAAGRGDAPGPFHAASGGAGRMCPEEEFVGSPWADPSWPERGFSSPAGHALIGTHRGSGHAVTAPRASAPRAWNTGAAADGGRPERRPAGKHGGRRPAVAGSGSVPSGSGAGGEWGRCCREREFKARCWTGSSRGRAASAARSGFRTTPAPTANAPWRRCFFARSARAAPLPSPWTPRAARRRPAAPHPRRARRASNNHLPSIGWSHRGPSHHRSAASSIA